MLANLESLEEGVLGLKESTSYLFGSKRGQRLRCSNSSQSFIKQKKNKDPVNFQSRDSLIKMSQGSWGNGFFHKALPMPAPRTRVQIPSTFGKASVYL